MNNINVGDRCIIIKSEAGNEGKIVEVVGLFSHNGDRMFEGDIWNVDCDVIVESLGSELKLLKCIGKYVTLLRVPIDSAWLRKLPTVDDLDVDYILMQTPMTTETK